MPLGVMVGASYRAVKFFCPTFTHVQVVRNLTMMNLVRTERRMSQTRKAQVKVMMKVRDSIA